MTITYGQDFQSLIHTHRTSNSCGFLTYLS